MAIVTSCVLIFLRILAHPIFPASANPELNAFGQKVRFLLFVHVVSGLFVLIVRTESTEYNINLFDNYITTSTERRNQVAGPHVFVTIFAIILNTPIFVTEMLLVFNWTKQDVLFKMHLGKCVTSIFIIIAIYVCSFHLIRRYDNCWRQERLTTNEYILIHVICSSGMMGYFVIGFLTAFSSPVPVHMFFVSRILSLLETFLQTYLLLKLKRCTA